MKKKKDGQKYHDSIASAAVAMGVQKNILQKAKDSGSPGFRGSRVYIDEVAQWIAKNASSLEDLPDKERAQVQKIMEDVRRLKMANDTRAGLVVERAAVFAAFTRGKNKLAAFKVELETKWPAKLAGLPDVPAAREECRRIVDRIYEVFGSMAVEFEPLDEPRKVL